MRPRGVPSRWLRLSRWYYTERSQPSRQAELRGALLYDYKANGEHYPVCREVVCAAEYLEHCDNEDCCGCIPTHCPCWCHDGTCGCGHYEVRE